MRGALLSLALAVLASCAPREPVVGYDDRETVYELQQIDGASFPAGATLRFPERGRVAGTLPCGTFAAQQTATYPWFLLSHFEVFGGRCPDHAAQERAVHALASVSRARFLGPDLILSGEDAPRMVFSARD